MGFQDRDYYRNTLPRGGFGYFRFGSVTTWLIAINVAVFLADALARRVVGGPTLAPGTDLSAYLAGWQGPLERWGAFSIEKGVLAGQAWRLITFQFLHANGTHLLFNMVALYLFGPIVEGHFGPRRYLAFYLLCGIAGGAAYAGLSLGHVLGTTPDTQLVGASAGIYGLLVAAALIAPEVQVFYYLFPVTIGMLAALSMLMALYQVIAAGHNAGGEAAHLGGGILGFALMKNQHWLNFVSPRRKTARMTLRYARPARKTRGKHLFQKDWSKDMNR